MKEETLKKGQELLEIIHVSETQLTRLFDLKEKRRCDNQHKYYNDGQYWFNICEHSDGSGCSAKLNRYRGNAELLDVIIKTLEKQIKEFKQEFEEL